MPNWCNCEMQVSGSSELLKEFISKCKATVEQRPRYKPYVDVPEDIQDYPLEEDKFCFHLIKPIPAKLLEKRYDEGGLEWEREHWGCKWGASDVNIFIIAGNARITFNTPWDPPLQLVDTLAKNNPELKFMLDYKEYDMQIYGYASWKNGKMLISEWTGHALSCLT